MELSHYVHCNSHLGKLLCPMGRTSEFVIDTKICFVLSLDAMNVTDRLSELVWGAARQQNKSKLARYGKFWTIIDVLHSHRLCSLPEIMTQFIIDMTLRFQFSKNRSSVSLKTFSNTFDNFLG